MKQRILAAALLLTAPLAITASSGTALAQDDDPNTIEARKRFKEGVRLFDAKQYERARAAFLQAYALKKHPAVLLNLAQAEAASGHPMDAIRHYEEYIQDPKTGSMKRDVATKGLAEVRKRIGRLQITVDAAGAAVLLDNRPLGNTPIAKPVDVLPGEHTVVVESGGKKQEKKVNAAKGVITPVDITFNAGAAAKPPPPVAPPPGGEETPPADEGGGRESLMSWTKSNPIAWGTGGAAVVGLTTGVVFLLFKDSASNNADSILQQTEAFVVSQPNGTAGNPCDPRVKQEFGNSVVSACSKYQDSADARDTNAALSTVGFVIGGLGLVGYVAGYFATAKKASPSSSAMHLGPKKKNFSLQLSPTVGLGYKGLTAVGRF